MAKNKVITRATAESRFQAAIRAAETLRDDTDLAEEIEDEGVEEWAERKGYTIENPRKKGGKKPMATRIKIRNSAIAEQNEALQEENEALRDENELLRARLADINSLSQDEEDEDEEEEDDEEEEEEDYEDYEEEE